MTNNKKLTKDQLAKVYLEAAKRYIKKEGGKTLDTVADTVVDTVEEITVKTVVAAKETTKAKGHNLIKAVFVKGLTAYVENKVEKYCGSGLLSKVARGADTLADINLGAKVVGTAYTFRKEYQKVDVEEVRNKVMSYIDDDDNDDEDLD